MKRQLYLLAGLASLALGSIGILLPLLPTVPFMILAAFCFANSSPRLEAWLVEHRIFGPHIKNWRDRRAITRRGKWSATVAFAVSCVIALLFVKLPWNLIPIAAALISGSWIWTRNEPDPSKLPARPPSHKE
ncbi:YbaN family protein [uncultured Parasphingorhabdus sp.]|uniref:YbaN family protein n=1 Tax=uncultured Parasphingorhabdus sp. TaxID=2709694 RepID=UPI0030D87B16|tara:strand:- start:12478 stop:12873 length:396 start_codon:yes stop_codon:yes gene_type:complete